MARWQVSIHTVTLDVRDLDSIAALPSQLPAEFAEVSPNGFPRHGLCGAY